MRPALLAAASLVALGCSGNLQVRVRPGGPLQVQAAAVYPVSFRWDEPAWRSYELGQLLVLQAMATGRYAVFGPGEFKLVRETADNPFIGSDIALGLANHGFSALQALVFRPWIEKRAQSAVKQLFGPDGKPRGVERVEEVTYLVHLEVFHSATREIVAESSATVEVDPFASHEPSDPQPELTEALVKLMRRTLAELADRAPGAPIERSAGFEYVWNPKAGFTFALERRPALADALRTMDLLEQDLAMEARLRFFLPDADNATLASLKRLPPGLLVTRVGPEALGAGLGAGDLVTEIQGEPALPQTLQRALRAARAGTPLTLRVRRSTGFAELALPIP
jgi:hypothetical protein